MSLRHAEFIEEFFAFWFEDWMDDLDKETMRFEILAKLGLTMQDLDNQIQIGLDNGYSLDEQRELMRAIHKRINRT